MNNKDFEPIRVRIMQEAYELADRNDAEGYNAVKVMCGDVQKMLSPKREWVKLTNEQFLEAARLAEDGNYLVAFQRIQQWLKEKNT